MLGSGIAGLAGMGLSGLGGASQGCLGSGQASILNDRFNQLFKFSPNPTPREYKEPTRKKTLCEELQDETNDWLDDWDN